MLFCVQVMEEEFSHTVLHRKPFGVLVQNPAAFKPAKPVIKRECEYRTTLFSFYHKDTVYKNIEAKIGKILKIIL